MEYVKLIFLLCIIFILIMQIRILGPSEQSKIKKFKRLLKRKYKEKNITFFRKIKLAGDFYYIFRTNKIAYTVSENGYVTIKHL